MKISGSVRGDRNAPVLYTLAAMVATAVPGAALAQNRTEMVVLSVQTAPVAGGGTFSYFDAPVLNAAGRIAFKANITGGSSSGGVFIGSGSGSGSVTGIGVEGQSAPGTGAGVFGRALFDRIPGQGLPVLNETGRVAFASFVTGGPNLSGVFFTTSSDVPAAGLLQGQPAPGLGGGTFGSFVSYDGAVDLLVFSSRPDINDAGQIAVAVRPPNFSSQLGVFRRDANGSIVATARFGDTAPGTGGTFTSFGDPLIGNAGHVAFTASSTSLTQRGGVFRSDSSGASLAPIALIGQTAPGTTGGTFASFSELVLNDAAQIAFRATVSGGGTTGGIFRAGSTAAISPIAVIGQSTSTAGGASFASLGRSDMNASGQIAFTAALTGGTVSSGAFRSSTASTLTAIALQGQAAPGLGGGVLGIISGNAYLGDNGLVAFGSSVTGGTTSYGFFIGDGREIVTVQTAGATLAGRTVSTLFANSGGLNRHGQWAYRASFSDGTSGLFLFTPELHWRESFSGTWDTSGAWTLGIAPASPHDVSIDPAATLTVTGPAGAASLRSLRVGSGNGVATLSLTGGTIGSTVPVQILGRGILTGGGTITAPVVNSGEIRADNLILSGGLTNNGRLRGSVTGNQRLQGNLSNNLVGVVQVLGGERLFLSGTSHLNAGEVEVRQGGSLDVTGSFANQATGQLFLSGGSARFASAVSNAAGGRIQLDDADVRFRGGLSNSGLIQVAFGESSIFGNVTVESGGRAILSSGSNTSFYDNVDVRNGGELRVSTGAVAVFFGQVLQRTGANFSGAGTKVYEGGLSVGGSPGIGTDHGDVGFGGGSEYLAEIGGTAPGTQYDRYLVDGHLRFGGVLKVVSWDAFVAQAGQRFDLFDWGSTDGRFDAIDADGLRLAAGTYLDVSRLYTDGSVSVAAVPEPAGTAMLLAGLGIVGGWVRARRRSRARRDASPATSVTGRGSS